MQLLKYSITLLGLFLLSSFPCYALVYDAAVSVGNLCEYVKKIQVDENGSQNACSFNPFVSASLNIPVSERLWVAPEFGLSLPRKGRDENISKISFAGLINGKVKWDRYHLVAGAGLFFTRISADGGDEELNNGNTTSSFPLPEGAVYTRNFIVNAGVGYDFTPTLSADLQTYIFNLLEKNERAVSVLINGTWHFGEL